MVLQLKKCGMDCLDELLQISKKTFVDAFEKDNDPEDFNAYITTAFDRKKLEEELMDPDIEFYFVYLEDTLAGYFKLNENHSQTDIKRPESIELERIYVLQSFQGNRIGEWMLWEAQKIGAKKGKEYLWLGVWEKNVQAIKFYLKHGFIKFGTHPYYIGKDEQTDWLMRVNLSNLDLP